MPPPTESSNEHPTRTMLLAENQFLHNRVASLEAEFNDTVDLLHIWKNNAHAYRLHAESIQEKLRSKSIQPTKHRH